MSQTENNSSSQNRATAVHPPYPEVVPPGTAAQVIAERRQGKVAPPIPQAVA